MDYVTIKQSLNYQKDKNCCAVVSLATAANIDFESAQAMFADKGRMPKQGTSLHISLRVMKLLMKTKRLNEYGNRTVCQTLRNLPKSGTFIIDVRGHIFTYKNGEIQDWVESNSRRRIENVWYVESVKDHANEEKVIRSITRGLNKLKNPTRKSSKTARRKGYKCLVRCKKTNFTKTVKVLVYKQSEIKSLLKKHNLELLGLL